MNKTIYEFIIPEWAMCPLINNDYSGLHPEDTEKLNQFNERIFAEYGNNAFMLPDTEGPDFEQGFKHYNDIDKLGSNCYKLLLLA